MVRPARPLHQGRLAPSTAARACPLAHQRQFVNVPGLPGHQHQCQSCTHIDIASLPTSQARRYSGQRPTQSVGLASSSSTTGPARPRSTELGPALQWVPTLRAFSTMLEFALRRPDASSPRLSPSQACPRGNVDNLLVIPSRRRRHRNLFLDRSIGSSCRSFVAAQHSGPLEASGVLFPGDSNTGEALPHLRVRLTATCRLRLP